MSLAIIYQMENDRRRIKPWMIGRINLADPSLDYALKHLSEHMRRAAMSPKAIDQAEKEIEVIKKTTPIRSLN